MSADDQLNNLHGRCVIVCGPGGVGKTSVSAAIGKALAVSRGRVVVLTIDPAKRLAQSLGLALSGNEVVEVGGGLCATMLDAKAGWDDLVRRFAPDAAAAERLLRNPLYQNITARFVNSHDYIAMERLYELSSNTDFDVVVVDTPPSRNALDFLNATDRMAEFFGGRLVRWLTIPYRNRFLGLASRPFFQIADRVLGARFLTDIIEFFVLLQALEEGFVERARLVRALLDSPECDYVVVTGLGADSVREANYLLDRIDARTSRQPTVLVNRKMPCPVENDRAGDIESDVTAAGELAARTGCDSESVERVLSALQIAQRAQSRRCSEHTEVCEQLRTRGVRVLEVPDMAVDAVAVVDQIAQSLIAK